MINRRHFLAGTSAAAILAVLPVCETPVDIDRIASLICARLDAEDRDPMTFQEWWSRRLGGGWEGSEDVAYFRATGQIPLRYQRYAANALEFNA